MEIQSIQVKLTSADFKGFGDTHDMLVFEKDGIEFHLRYASHGTHLKNIEEVKQENSRLGKSTGGLSEFFTFNLANRAAAKREALAAQSGSSSTTGSASPSLLHLDSASGDVEIKGIHLKSNGTAPDIEIQVGEGVEGFAQQILDNGGLNPRSISANVPPEAIKDFEGDSLNTSPEGQQLNRFPTLGGKHRHTPTDDKPN
jgi:hypothetical protein